MVFTAIIDPLVLAAQPDPVTGQAVYGLPPESAGPAGSGPTVRDLMLVEGGKIAGVPGSGSSLIQVSHLPEGRMAATWEDIARTLRGAEDGGRGGVDVELLPGGELVLTGREQLIQPLSQLPKGRMAWLPPS